MGRMLQDELDQARAEAARERQRADRTVLEIHEMYRAAAREALIVREAAKLHARLDAIRLLAG